MYSKQFLSRYPDKFIFRDFLNTTYYSRNAGVFKTRPVFDFNILKKVLNNKNVYL